MSKVKPLVVWACGGTACAVVVNVLIGWATKGPGPDIGAGLLELLVLLLVPGLGAYVGVRHSGSTPLRWKNAWVTTLGSVCIALVLPIALYAVSGSPDGSGLPVFMVVLFFMAAIVAVSTLIGFGVAEATRSVQTPP